MYQLNAAALMALIFILFIYLGGQLWPSNVDFLRKKTADTQSQQNARGDVLTLVSETHSAV